jgi:xylitol oxidase
MLLGESVSCFVDWSKAQIHSIWIRGNQFVQLPNCPNAYLVKDTIEAPGKERMISATREGKWWEILPFFQPNEILKGGSSLQAEYMIPFEKAANALKTLAGNSSAVHAIQQIARCCELRIVKGDRITLSHSRDHELILCIHFTLIRNEFKVMHYLPQIEKALLPFNPRPHLAKLSTFSPEQTRNAYHISNCQQFSNICQEIDPKNIFKILF